MVKLCRLCGNRYSDFLCSGILLTKAGYIFGMERKQKVPPSAWKVDNSNYDCKTDCMGAGIYPGLWHACRRRCEIFHDFIQSYHVVLPCGTVYI